MSLNTVQPIETSHYTYDAHKSSATDNKHEPTHHSASSTTAKPTASKIHPVVDKLIEHPHTTTAVVAAPASNQHPHTATVERPHAIAEHAQPAVVQHPAHPAAAVVPSKDKETPKHPLTEPAKTHPRAATTIATATATHPHVAFEQHPEHPIVTAIPSHSSSSSSSSSSSRPAAEHIEDKHNATEETHPHPHHIPHHNRSHNHHSQHEAFGERPPHKHDYNESPHPPHPAHPAHHSASTNTHANDALITSDSILSESPPANSGAERRQSWSKDEMKRGVMESLLEKEGGRKVAKGGYSSTSAGGH